MPSVLLSNFGGYEIYGKTHKDLIIKCLELLEDIRYFKPDEVLQLLSNLSLNNDKDIRAKALEITKKFAEYNYNVLKKSEIGYGAQRKILDFILAWSRKDRLKNYLAHHLKVRNGRKKIRLRCILGP